MQNDVLYFDIAATTPIDSEVLDLIHKINSNIYGNPSSIHHVGQKAHNLIEKSRISIANILNCKSSEIYFTSGGSESNNLSLKGILSKGDHLITSSYEHPSVLNLAKDLTKNNIEVSFIKPNNNGQIDLDNIKTHIQPNTKLISIMYVNNELGTINPIKKIGAYAKSKNILFHSDAVQFVGKKPLDISTLNVDLMSIGAHKFYGPKGIGLLYIKTGINVNPIIGGGGQESGIRAGTENTSFIAGMELALKIAHNNMGDNNERLIELENYFIDKLKNHNINYRINGENRLPGFLNLTFKGIDGHGLLMNLDMNNIAISFGSACASGSATPPLALIEMGIPKEEAKCTVRISIGKFITKNNIDKLVVNLDNIIRSMKKQ